MRFYFVHDDKYLLRPAPQGGCGVTAEEIEAIEVWQQVLTYQFEFHLENHGPYVYIFPDGRNAGQKKMPRYYFGGGRVGTFDNEESLLPGVQADVKAVVDANRDLFEAMHSRFYGLGGIAREPIIGLQPAPALAYFTCASQACGGRNQIIAVRFPSEVEMRKQIKMLHIGPIRSLEYPVIPCGRQACGVGMELLEFGSSGEEKLRIKETIDFPQ